MSPEIHLFYYLEMTACQLRFSLVEKQQKPPKTILHTKMSRFLNVLFSESQTHFLSHNLVFKLERR